MQVYDFVVIDDDDEMIFMDGKVMASGREDAVSKATRIAVVDFDNVPENIKVLVRPFS